MSDNGKPTETTPTPRRMSEEIMAIALIERILGDLTPSSAQRVANWMHSVTEERVEEEFGLQFDVADFDANNGF